MTLTKDGNPLFGAYNTEWQERITQPLSEEEQEKLDAENEWLQHLKGERKTGQPAIRNARPAGRLVSRSQRGAVIGEKDGEVGTEKNNKQRKAIRG